MEHAQQYLWSYLGDTAYKIEPTDVKNIFWVELQDSTTIDEITKKISSIKDVEIIKGLTLKSPFEILGVDADESKRRGKTTIKVKSNIVNLEGGGSMAEEGVELSPKERGRLDELQKKEDIDNLNELENKEYEILVNKYRKTKEYKHYKKSYGDSMATGSGHIKNQYEGKSAEEVWNAWTHSQRLHFLTDHETELEQEKALLGIRQEIIFRTFYEQPYQELHEIIKETLHYHIFAGQYAGGGSMEKGGATDILYIESWYNDGKTQMLGSDGTGILRGKPTDRGIENAMDRQAKLLKSLIGIKPFLKDGNVVIKAVDRTGKVIKTKTINLEQLSSGGSMARGGKSDIVPYVVYGKRLKQTPSGFESVWETIHHLDRKPSKGDAEKHRNEFNESLKKGGANEHLGTNYRVTDAKIINQKTGEEIDFYKAPTFETFSEGAALSDKFGAKPNPIVPIWQGGLYYLKLDNLIRDNYNKTMKIKGYFKDGIRVIENTDFPLANQQLIDIPFNILAEFIDSGRFKIANVVYETERDKKLLQNEINYIVDAHKAATTEAEKARLAREVATTEAEKARLAREVATTEAEKARLEGDYTERIMDIRDSFKKTAKEYSDTIAGMEAMAGGVKAGGEKKYSISFIGRKTGAIGKTYRIRENIISDSQDNAIMKLYDKYELIGEIKIDGKKVSLIATGGGVDDRMYNFLKDDLKELEKAIKEGNNEEVERFFSYWGYHLKSLKTKTNDRMYNFLKDDLKELEKAIKEGNNEEVERFFSYWGYHLKSLKTAQGGSMATGGGMVEQEVSGQTWDFISKEYPRNLKDRIINELGYSFSHKVTYKELKDYLDKYGNTEIASGSLERIYAYLESTYAGGGEIYKPEKKGTIFRGNELIKYYQKVNGNYRLNFYRMDETKSKIPVHCDKFGDCLFADIMDVQPADLYVYIKEGKFLAQGGSMAEGGKRLPTKYIRIEKKSYNMSPEEVWESWGVDQRYHFLLDHESQLNELGLTNKDEIFNSKNNSYSGLSEEISSILNNHVKEGVRYAIGGSMAGGGVGSYEEWKAVDAPHPLSYRAYKLKEGHFKITHVDESGEYQLGYTSSPIDFIKETAKPYKIKKLSSGGSMAIGGRLSDSERFKSYASAKFSELKTALANKKITEDQFDKKTTALGHEIETKFHELLMKQGKTEEEAIRMASKQRNDFFTEQYSFTKGGKAQPTNQYIWGHGEILDSYPSDIGGSSASVEHIIEFEGKKYIVNTNQDEDKVLYANKPAILSENSDNSAAKGVKINGSSPIKKINKKDKFWHARIISPKGAKTCAVPEWAETIASTVHEGAKVTTCIMGDKEWHVQKVMVPVKGINKSKAKSIAEQIVAKIIKN